MNKNTSTKSRRSFLARSCALGMATSLSSIGVPAFAQSRTKIKVGYLETLAVTGQIWTGVEKGYWTNEGLELDLVKFNTGLEMFNAMIGGSLDMLSTGAVISNFPARGQGKVFLINDVEYATAQLWVRTDKGVSNWSELKGKKIATTVGTTAHVFLDTALRANGIDPTKDVEVINQGMAAAVTSFISGAVDAVALWVPFNIVVRDKVPTAKMLVDASAYFPKAAIVDGWATRADYFEKNQAICAKVVRAWISSNDELIRNSDALLPILQKNNFPQVPLAELKEQFNASKYYPSSEWKKMIQDGTVTTWLQQVTDFYTRIGGIQNPIPASTYFDPKLFLEAMKG